MKLIGCSGCRKLSIVDTIKKEVYCSSCEPCIKFDKWEKIVPVEFDLSKHFPADYEGIRHTEFTDRNGKVVGSLSDNVNNLVNIDMEELEKRVKVVLVDDPNEPTDPEVKEKLKDWYTSDWYWFQVPEYDGKRTIIEFNPPIEFDVVKPGEFILTEPPVLPWCQRAWCWLTGKIMDRK